MNSLYVNKFALKSFLVFVIAPLYSLPLIVAGILRRQKWAFILFAVFMGIMGLLWPPTGDLYRYTEDFFLYRDCSWDSFIELIQFKFDYILPLLSYGLGRLGLPFDLTRFLYNFFGYYLVGLLFIDICNNNKKLCNYRIYIFALIILIPFSFADYLFRYGLSTIIFAYGGYFIFYRNKKKGWLYLLLACFNHFSFIVFMLSAIAVKFHFFRFRKITIGVLILFIISFNSTSISFLLNYLPVSDQLLNYLMNYFDGYWGGEYLEDHSLSYRIMVFLSSLIIYVFYFGYVMTYEKGDVRHQAYVNSFIVLALLVAPFSVIYGRFLSVSLLMVKFHFLCAYDDSFKMRRYLKIFVFCAIMSNFMWWWGARKTLTCSAERILFYSSLVQIVTFSYSEDWIDNNIYPDGDLIKK